MFSSRTFFSCASKTRIAVRSYCTNHRFKRLLIANRGEIALRIARAAQDVDMDFVTLQTFSDEKALHAVAGKKVVRVPSYSDVAAVVAAAIDSECDALHPGYGFLSESAALAVQCERAGIAFCGPTAETLNVLGDKVAARELAASLGVPVAPASESPCESVNMVRTVMAEQGLKFPVMLKARGGGGGRGMRPVWCDVELEGAFAACLRESSMIGAGSIFVEQLVTDARHIEVQLLGDHAGNLIHLFERECSVQRRRQKLIEYCPAHGIDDSTRARLHEHALAIGRACSYRSAGTCEFLVNPDGEALFLEFNPRIQVEHTVSEEATGVDIVQAQLLIAGGAPLPALGLSQDSIRLQSVAVQARVQMCSPGLITAYAPPGGPGIRVDGSVYSGYAPSTEYDPLLAKLVARADVSVQGAFALATRRLQRACSELHIGGDIRTNVEELRAVLASPVFARGAWTTALLDESGQHPPASGANAPSSVEVPEGSSGSRAQLLDSMALRGAEVAAGPSQCSAAGEAELDAVAAGCVVVRAAVDGRVMEDGGETPQAGAQLRVGDAVVVLSSMKMEFVVPAPCAGELVEVLVQPGAHVGEGQPVALLRALDAGEAEAGQSPSLGGVEVDAPPRPDLAEMLERRRQTTDQGRTDAGGDPRFVQRVAARAARGQRTARQNIEALVDSGSFFEYGRFAVAAQRSRRSLEELQRRTPADGMVAGVGSVNGDEVGTHLSKAVVVAYDATVLAGTQGAFNHMKLDRMLALAESQHLPLVLFAEGGGGRPGDVDIDLLYNSQLAVNTFRQMGRLSGRVPLVGVGTGFCFAGNAALLGTCDVIISTPQSNIGMAGPAMVEGGGLGKVAPTAIGPCSEQARNGVVDLVAANDAEACELAKKYLRFFQGSAARPAGGSFPCADQRLLRSAVPENRKRTYEVRQVIETLVDAGSWLELRRGFAAGMVSGLARVDGRSVGVLANSAEHLGGAVDADGALKAARFMELCDAFDLPLLLLCDTPGFMVGPHSERAAAVRKMARLFAVGASLRVPFVTLVLRRAYGLGAMAMSGGLAAGPNVFHASWPSAEAGPMNLEGAVELGFAKELAAAGAKGGDARQQLFEQLMAKGFERAGALSVARTLETDDVIDPADSRAWIINGLDAAAVSGAVGWRTAKKKKRPCVSPW